MTVRLMSTVVAGALLVCGLVSGQARTDPGETLRAARQAMGGEGALAAIAAPRR